MNVSLIFLFLALASISLLAFAVALFLGKRRLKAELEKVREELRQVQNTAKTYRLLAENINDVVFIVDLATLRYTYVSPSLKSTFGFEPEESITLTLHQSLTPPSLELGLKALAQELERDKQPGIDPNRHLTLEIEQYRKDGSVIPVETVVKFLRDDTGRPVSIIGVARDITERRKAETALRETEKIHRLLNDNITEMIAVINLEDMSHLFITPSVEKLCGFTPEEIMAKSFDQLFTPRSYQAAMQAITEELSRNGRPGVDPAHPRTLELEQYCKDGSTIWTEVVASLTRDETGRPIHIVAATRDISERKKVEAALRKSEERYRLLAENISEVIFILDIETMRYIFISPSSLKTYGYTPQEALNITPAMHLAPNSFELVLKTIAQELERDSVTGVDPNRDITLEAEHYRKDGSTIWIETIAKIMRDETGRPVSFVGVGRDITERKKAETALRESEKRYRMLADNSSEAIYIVDLATRRYTYVSPSATRSLGYTPEEFSALTFDQLLTPSSLDFTLTTIARELEQEGLAGVDPVRYSTLQVEVIRKDGSTVWTEAIGTFLRDQSGRPVSILVADRDISERKKAETALRESEKRYRMLAENITEMIAIITINDQSHLYITPSVKRLRGFTPEEVMAQPFDQVLTPGSYQLATQAIAEELARDGQPGVDPDRYRTLELEQICKDGSVIWTEVIGKFIRDESGRPISVLVTARDISERKKAETALRESEKLYRLLADNINEVIYILDLKTLRYIYATPSVLQTHGYTVKEFLQLPLGKVLTPETFDMATERIKAELEKDGRPGVDPNRFVKVEIQAYHKNGSTLWMDNASRFLRNEAGQPVSILGLASDITERKKTEMALLKSEERYRMVTENINEVIFILDLETLQFNFVSPSVIRTYGYTQQEAVSMTLERLLTPPSFELVLNKIAQELEQDRLPGIDPNRYITLEAEHYRKDGSTIWVESTVKPWRDETGRPTSVVGVSRDITERKKAENSLRESEQRYRMLAENVSEVIYLFNPRTLRFIFTTPSVSQMFGYTPEEFLELPFDKLLTPQSLEVALKAIEAELARGKEPEGTSLGYVTLEHETYCKDGSTLCVETVGRVFFDKNGEPIHLLGLTRDLTQQKAAEEAMKQAKEAAEAASRVKSEFLANMSHEIRTPLNGVIGMAELLQETPLAAEQFEYVNSLKSSADALLVIINDVLDFSKIEAGKLRLEIIEFDLEKLCKEVHDTVLPRAKRKQIAYKTVISEEVPVRLKGDSVRLRQVLINLCENAVKFTEKGSVTVTVSAAEKTGKTITLQFEIADTGIGIPPEHQQRIFDSFSQVDASTTRRYGGTGLGLAISKRLISLLGGKIGVTSEPGRGSTFRFSVTLEQVEQQLPATPASLQPSTPAGETLPLKILLVDDNSMSLKVITHMLERLGHVVTVAFNGAEAVDTYSSQTFDLVFMDIQMPVMDGITATGKIHALQRENGRKVPVIALTANAMAGDRERFLNQGLDDYIAKPITLATLQSVIRRNTV